NALIIPVGFTSLAAARDVLEFFKSPKIGVSVEPDDQMRPDGVTILQGGGYTFLVAYSAKLLSTSLSGGDREDDLASLDPSTWYDLKPSAKAKRAERKEFKELMSAASKAPKARKTRPQSEETSQNDGAAVAEEQL